MLRSTTSKALLVALFMLIVACILLYIYIFRIDNRYTLLISKEIDNFQTLQKFTAESNRNFFLLYDALYPQDRTDPAAIQAQWLHNVDENSARIDTITRRALINPVGDPYYSNLIDARKEYFRKTGNLFRMIESHQKDSAAPYFQREVKPCFAKYQSLLEKFVEQHKLQMMQFSENISSDAKKASLSILVIGFSPVLIASIVLVVVGVVLAILFLSLKGFDLNR
jgi:hypothetical protein